MRLQSKFAITSIITVLVTIFSLQGLAEEVEIQGWDKARLGMSPEELKGVYAEEEEYFKPDAFWEEKEEDKFSHIPYTLFTSRLKILEYGGGITFLFVNEKLFKIIMTGGEEKIVFGLDGLLPLWEAGKLRGIMTPEERKRKMMEAREQLKLMKKERQFAYSFELNLPSELLTNKYGEPSIIECYGGAIHRWDDEKGNILLLRDYVPLSANEPESPSLNYFFIMTYTSRELMNLWTAKIEEWEKEHKRITEKGIEVF